MSQKLAIKKTPKGVGVFATREIGKGEKIVKWRGKIVTGKGLPHPYSKEADYFTQIGQDAFMGPSGKKDDFINHSCNPNSGLIFDEKSIWLTAIKKIKKSKEITWDYATTMTPDGIKKLDHWSLRCLCGSSLCRKKVNHYKNIPRKILHRYSKLKILAPYINLQKIKNPSKK